MTQKALSIQKLKNSLENVQSQLKLERASSQAKDNMIKSLEDLVIEIGYNPTDIKAEEELIKNKNATITALKKQLKLPTTEHPQTKEVLETLNQKDEMMNLIIQLTTQLREMETEMDKLVQEKQASREEVPITTIPIGATTATTSTSVPTATSSTTATTSAKSTAHPTNEANKLIQAMEDMSIQTTHINKLKEQVKSLED